MDKLTLCILAAGMGSRYGWLKQIDGFWPNNEAIIEYSVYDAIQAGFSKVVIVIKKDIELMFKEKFQHTFLDKIQVEFAYQELDISDYGHTASDDRIKPRGTWHAVMSASKYIDWPFVLISADDYYWPHMMKLIAQNMSNMPSNGWFIVCYHLENTLSDFGTVNRGICQESDSKLISIQEHLKISKQADWSIIDQDGIVLAPQSLVTMLSYCFQPSLLHTAQKLFQQFLDNNPWPTDEFFLPSIVDYMMRQEEAVFKILISPDQRSGVTNPNDKSLVQKHFAHLVAQGIYPHHLWS
jgi:UTP-glucose-1-phosphate uridylyltransferase